jgi:DNA-binding NarL/FixJ family response regulator
VTDRRPVAVISHAEREVLTELMKTGGGNREIGKKLNKAEDTVKSQIRSLLRTFGVQTRTELMAEVYNERWRIVVSHNRPMTRRQIAALTHEEQRSTA